MITLNLLLIVDEIVLDDVALTCYLDSALSNGCYVVKIDAFELIRMDRDVTMEESKNVEQFVIDGWM